MNDGRNVVRELEELARAGQMSPVREGEPYLVEMKRGPGFGVEYYSAPTKAEAYRTAMGCFGEDPDWVRVIDRSCNEIFSSSILEKGRAKLEKRLGFTTVTFGVSVDLEVGSQGFSEIVTTVVEM